MQETSAIKSTITSQPSSSPPPPPQPSWRSGHQCEPDDAEDGWEARAAPSSPSQELLAPPPPELPPPNPEKPPPEPLPPSPPKPNEPPEPPPPPKLRLPSWKAARLWTVTYQIH